jgi:hypothetical protein
MAAGRLGSRLAFSQVQLDEQLDETLVFGPLDAEVCDHPFVAALLALSLRGTLLLCSTSLRLGVHVLAQQGKSETANSQHSANDRAMITPARRPATLQRCQATL